MCNHTFFKTIIICVNKISLKSVVHKYVFSITHVIVTESANQYDSKI